MIGPKSLARGHIEPRYTVLSDDLQHFAFNS